MKIKYIGLLWLLFSSLSFAQIQIGSGISTDSMLVGDQFMYKIGVKGNQLKDLKWPKIKKQIGDFEIIEETGFDTVSTNPLSLEIGYILTYFDTGLIEVPSQVFVLNTDTVETQKHFVQVLPVHIDTSNAYINGFHPPIDPIPYRFGEFINYIYWAVGIILFLALVIFGVYYYEKNKKTEPVQEIKIPAHILALGELSELESKSLIEDGKVKTYYSNLSDILRRYLENRYGFLALESTTDEILKDIKQHLYKTQNIKDINEFLQDADLVKFAKASLEEHQHEKYFNFVKDFVIDTKISEVKKEEEDEQ